MTLASLSFTNGFSWVSLVFFRRNWTALAAHSGRKVRIIVFVFWFRHVFVINIVILYKSTPLSDTFLRFNLNNIFSWFLFFRLKRLLSFWCFNSVKFHRNWFFILWFFKLYWPRGGKPIFGWNVDHSIQLFSVWFVDAMFYYGLGFSTKLGLRHCSCYSLLWKAYHTLFLIGSPKPISNLTWVEAQLIFEYWFLQVNFGLCNSMPFLGVTSNQHLTFPRWGQNYIFKKVFAKRLLVNIDIIHCQFFALNDAFLETAVLRIDCHFFTLTFVVIVF